MIDRAPQILFWLALAAILGFTLRDGAAGPPRDPTPEWENERPCSAGLCPLGEARNG